MKQQIPHKSLSKYFVESMRKQFNYSYVLISYTKRKDIVNIFHSLANFDGIQQVDDLENSKYLMVHPIKYELGLILNTVPKCAQDAKRSMGKECRNT